MEVWIVESGDYEQRGINFVAASKEAAIEHLKQQAKPPYIVEWDDPVQDDEKSCSITGHFARVLGFSTKHSAIFDISRYEVIEA